ncbi:MAG: DNA-3-methyladenine glycosidase [Clostridiales bacterium 43-6]|nr:MAG: DNA-3-methyladenine glycosidase [Clostridiales bacterium 43-6]
MDRTCFQYGSTETEYLKSKCDKMALLIDRYGLIERRVIPDLFSALVSSIISQQVSAKAADSVFQKLTDRFGAITAKGMDEAESDEIRLCGMSGRKAEYIKGIAKEVVSGRLKPRELSEMTDEEVIKRLSALKGIGVWSAEMLLIFSLERPDVVSYGDLAIRRGMRKLYGLHTLSKKEFLGYRQLYSPYGTVASFYIWEHAHDQSDGS